MPKETPGVSFPLEENGKNAGYDLCDVKEAVKFNVKNIVLTNPGERVMDSDFGAGIYQALFLNMTDKLLLQIAERIQNQLSTYAPYITVNLINVRPNGENSLKVSIKYKIDFENIADVLELEI